MAGGVLIGKFMPPHLGHTFLVGFALRYVERLKVMISSTEPDSICCEKRLRWLKELYPLVDFQVVEHPIEPESTERWAELIRDLDFQVDFLFVADRLGKPLAEKLSCHLVTVDPPIVSLELESREIRNDPRGHWDRIPGVVRRDILKRVCVFGPESTGKSTLCEMLARHFQTVAVPEYSRTYLEKKEGEYELSDVVPVARGQRAWEYAYSLEARRVLFCDTDMLTTKIWSEWLFGECDPWIEEAIEGEHYDLYLLTAADVPWVEDKVRYLPEDRENFERACQRELESYGRRYVKLTGDWEVRFETAVRAVDLLLTDPRRLGE